MSMTKRADSVRWTKAAIRKATLNPKPTGAIARAMDLKYGVMTAEPKRAPVDLRALRHIANHADFLDVPTPKVPGLYDSVGWLLVPVSPWLLDALACFAAESEDLERDEDYEDAGDFEQLEEEEDGGDDEWEELEDGGELEPIMTAPDRFSGAPLLEHQNWTVRRFNSEG